MSFSRLLLRNIRYYWRSLGAVLAGTALATAILVGALAVGSSVKQSLIIIGLSRLGDTDYALVAPERWLREELADEVKAQYAEETGSVVPVVQLRGMITGGDPQKRVNGIHILGVDARFAKLWPSSVEGNGGSFPAPTERGLTLNQQLANELNVGVGDSVLLYIENPDVMPSDAPLALNDDRLVAARLKVTAIASTEAFGDFSLQSNQASPRNAYLSLKWLQNRLDRPGKANLLLVDRHHSNNDENKAHNLSIRDSWNFEDAQLELMENEESESFDIISDRIFLDTVINEKSQRLPTPPLRIFSYFVNEFSFGGNSVPYSIVTGLASNDELPSPLPVKIDEGKIVINQWLSEQLHCKIGDNIRISYYVFGDRGRLLEKQESLTVQAVVPINGIAADRSLMPEFPGLIDAKNSADWDAGIPIDTSRIRDVDEEYWDTYRGTPKAFLSLTDAQRMWANRFGSLSMLRFPVAEPTDQIRATIEADLLKRLSPSDFGFTFFNFREQALKAGTETTDFGGLFIGFSFFLIISALVLSALLFILGIDQRRREIGTLLALGWPARRIRRLFLWEGTIISLIGVTTGLFIGQLYTKAMIHGLNTLWYAAVRTDRLAYHAPGWTLLAGAMGTLLLILIITAIALKYQANAPVRNLLSGLGSAENTSPKESPKRPKFNLLYFLGIFILLLLVAISFTAAGMTAGFFAAGFFVLYTGFAPLILLSSKLASYRKGTFGFGRLALNSSLKKRGRSLTATLLLALGTFMVVAVGLNHRSADIDANDPTSGTGGFEFFAISTIPILENLETKEGRETLNLDTDEFAGVSFVVFRSNGGEEASCLNLNRSQRPRILGVNPETLDEAKAFSNSSGETPWPVLASDSQNGTVPAIADANSAQWALGIKKNQIFQLSDELERGRDFQLAATLRQSILQGSLIISDENFSRLFPSTSGYTTFLIDAPPDRLDELESLIERRLERYGVDLTRSTDRLAEFQSVENTYLSIFLILGGMGLALGCVSLGVVLMRNMIERRAELALLTALGFTRRRIHRLIMLEHLWLVAAGIIIGAVSGAVAVLPIILKRFDALPIPALLIVLGIISLSAVFWVWFATTLALRGQFIRILQQD